MIGLVAFYLFIQYLIGGIIGPPGGGGGLTEKEVEEIVARAEKIGTTQLVKESVTEEKIKNLAVTAAKLAAEAVTAAKLGKESVTEEKVKNLAITAAKLAEEAVTAAKIGNEAVTEEKIKALAVTAAKLAAEAVTTEKLKNLAVTAAKIGEEAVETGKIKKLAITTEKLALGATGWLVATQFAGVDPTGTVDSTKGLEKFLEECFSKNMAGFIPNGKYKIGGEKKSLDFTKVWGGSLRVENFELYCAGGCVFEGSAELVKEPVVKLGPTAKGELVTANIKFGAIFSGFKESNCLQITGYSDGFLRIGYLKGASEAERAEMSALFIEIQTEELSSLVANNTIEIGTISTCGFGIRTLGKLAASAIQCSANIFIVSEIIKCLHTGVEIDANGVGHNTEWNTFIIASIEHNEGAGISENNGNNKYLVSSSNSNGAGFSMTEKAVEKNAQKAPPYVRGSFRDSIQPSKNPIDFVNSVNGELAWVEVEELSANLKTGEIGEGGKKVACALVDGKIVLTGNMKVAVEFAANSTLFKLPIGFRPVKARNFAAWSNQQIKIEAGKAAAFFMEVTPGGLVRNSRIIEVGTFIGCDGSQFPLRVLGE